MPNLFKITTQDGEFYIFAEDMSDAIYHHSDCLECELIEYKVTPCALRLVMKSLKERN